MKKSEKANKLEIGKFNFYSQSQENFTENKDNLGQKYLLNLHYIENKNNGSYFCGSYWYPTGNCQLFSMVYVNTFIDSIQTSDLESKDILSMLKYIYVINRKRMCFIDINLSYLERFHKYFDEFIEWQDEIKYKSTNGSDMVAIIVRFKNIIEG